MSKLVKRLAVVATALVVGFLLSGLPAALRADEAIPDNVRTELEALLRKKAGDLLADKNADGVSFKRGTYSKGFRKIDDSTYETGFHVDTAGDEQLKTERYLVTLKKDASGKWAIAGEKLQETYDGLYRGLLGDEEFYAFDAFTFDREGMKIRAGKGFLVKDFFMKRPARYTFVAPDLAYEYEPPPDYVDFQQVYRHVMLKKYGVEVVFPVESAWIECVPASCSELESSTFKGLRKVTLAETDPKLQRIYDKAKNDAIESRKKNPFTSFRTPATEDRRTYTISLKKDAAKDHYIWFDYDNWSPWEVSVGTSETGPVFAYYSEETRKSGIPPYELESREDIQARNYDLDTLQGTVEVAVQDSETLSGDVTFGITIKRDLRELPFFIARQRRPGEDTSEAKNPKLFINALQDEKGNDLTWVKTGPYSGIVVFPQTVTAGTKMKLRMQFTNLDSIYKLNPSYSRLDRAGWLPFVRFSDMIYDFDLTVKVPGKYQVLGIGKKTADAVKGGLRVTRWQSEKPVTFPTIIFGEYESDGPSFPAKKLDGTEIPVRVYVDLVSMQTLDTKIVDTGYGTFDDADKLGESLRAGQRGIRGSQLKAVADQAANALNLYSTVYGIDYPFAKLDLVCDPEGAFYGQAPASIIYLGFGVFRGEGFVAGGGLFGRAGADISRFNKDVVAHETGHQWWGGTIVNANDRNYWFVESLAELSSALFVEAVNEQQNKTGRKKYLEKVGEWRRNILEAEGLTSVQNAPSLWGGENPFQGYVANVYNKGPYAFHILRETFGDEKFFAFLKAMSQSLEGKEIITRDLQALAEKSFGGNMDWFFDQWIRGIGIPQYSVNYAVRKTEDGKWLVEGKVRQRVVFGPEKKELPGVFYRAVAPITFVGHDGKEFRSKPLLVQGAETPFQMKLPSEPAEVAFNRNGEILAHDVLVNRPW